MLLKTPLKSPQEDNLSIQHLNTLWSLFEKTAAKLQNKKGNPITIAILKFYNINSLKLFFF